MASKSTNVDLPLLPNPEIAITDGSGSVFIGWGVRAESPYQLVWLSEVIFPPRFAPSAASF